jgi:hypothetical protein
MTAAFERISLLLAAIPFFLATTCPPAFSRDFFVNSTKPKGVNISAGGFKKNSWSSVQEVLDSGKVMSGDRIVLGTGSYGKLWLNGYNFDPPVQIFSNNGSMVHFESIKVGNSSGLEFGGLFVWPLSPNPKKGPLIATSSSTDRITFAKMDVRGRSDANETFLNWSVRDWTKTWRSSGIELRGSNNVIEDSKISATAFAITLRGAGSKALRNRVNGFSGDGIRVLGDNSIVSNNIIENCFNVDSNHDDGIQSWAPKDVAVSERRIFNLRLDGNKIFEWSENQQHPLRCRLQGIGFFDGMFYGAEIVNNLVVVDHYHGISIYGAVQSRVLNNTVVHTHATGVKSPAIRLNDHKKGYKSNRNVFANNIAMGYINESSDILAFSVGRNASIRYPNRVFRDIKLGDYRLRSKSDLNNTANSEFAPEFDINGRSRTSEVNPDYGAFEID